MTNEISKIDGTYQESHGGTELMKTALFSKVDPDLLSKFQIILSRVRDIEVGKKKILWLHDYYTDFENHHLYEQFSKQRFDKFVFVSYSQFQSYAQAYNIPYAKSIVLRNAIEPIEYLKKPEDKINIIYHTTPHRGLELLVPAFIHVAEQFPNIHLDVYSSFEIYGWGHRDEPFKPLFELCQNHPQITYHGYKPNSEVREALQKAHIFGFPSIWPETSCIAAIEAAAAGCLVLAPDFAALSETLSENPFMYHYVEDRTEHANLFAGHLHKAITSVLDARVQNFLQGQSQVFNQKYSWSTRTKEWENMLRSLL